MPTATREEKLCADVWLFIDSKMRLALQVNSVFLSRSLSLSLALSLSLSLCLCMSLSVSLSLSGNEDTLVRALLSNSELVIV